ncbi:phosphopantothenoylcysteine decarboxylase subunit VHS3 [Pyrus ussuriensis x Pyrus communis]|uniref:Phosphopantothenoylcysteine decarboxylase subunit VHS3 n=1 Tax=Pyrus ussuriensis x Pyrus communis TaxID=2448454 RepID=A0A5N5H3R6_9ROSA|nr:phosphopantothenoylcysteine decarboxylase subunit VHS3 [Pyrus ussuriensis x Pyrus communis]
MMFVGVPRPIFLLLFLASALVLSYFLQSISRRDLQFSSNPLFVFSLFNIIIGAIIVGNHRPSSGEADDAISFVYHSYELEEDGADDSEDAKSDKYSSLEGCDHCRDHVDDNDDGESEDGDFDFEGYEEDDDDNGSDDEIGWGDMDEYDCNLEKRIEDFIDKVNKGWREERLRDGLSYPLQLTYL